MVFSGLGSKPVATVSTGMASKPVAQFFGSGLKTGSYSLMIWVLKSPWWFFGLDLKAK
jgi:hypothetical protein